MKVDDDPFDLGNLRLPPEQVQAPGTPRKIANRRKHFIQVPFYWVERLAGASGQTWHLAMHLLYLHWKKGRSTPIKLANGMLQKVASAGGTGVPRPYCDRATAGQITSHPRPGPVSILKQDCFKIGADGI